MTLRPHARYFRLVYTNGASAQSYFRLQTTLNKYITMGDTMGIDHVPKSGDDAVLVKAVIAGYTSAGGGRYVDVKVNPSGSIQMAGGATASDSYATPTDSVSSVSLSMGYNGTTWDRLRSSIAHGLQVDVTRSAGLPTALGQTTMSASTSVTMASDQPPIKFKQYSITPSTAQIASSASNITLASSNTSRLGLSIFNDSTQSLYVKLGTTASSTSYTVQIAAGGYYELPYGYIGNIDGIWASANGNAYVTELT